MIYKSIIAVILVFSLILGAFVLTNAASLLVTSVSSVECEPGETIVIPILLDNNPGFVSMSLSVTYDTSALTLTFCEYTDLIGGSVHSTNYTSPYTLTWENDLLTSNITKTGVIAYLTFLVSKDAEEQEYFINVSIPTDGVLDANGNTVSASRAVGTIAVSTEHECTFGEWIYYNQNKHYRYCDECGEKEYESHNWNDGEIVVKPTHEDEGEIIYACEYCSAEKTEEIPPIGHAYGSWTNFDDEQHMRKCDCGDVEYEDHSWDGGVITKQPTSTDAGIRTYTCEDCDATKTESIPPNPVPVTGVTLNKVDETLKVGSSVSLVATIAPNNATNKNVTWSSSDSTVASVMNGVVTAHRAGSATITVKTEDGGFFAECVITVETDPPYPPVTSITFDNQNITLILDSTDYSKLLIATVLPADATNAELVWTNSNESVVDLAFFDDNTRVLLVGLVPGTATITATAENGAVTAQCRVTVVEASQEHTHSYGSKVTAPTCTEKGYTTYTCSCGDTYIDDYVDAAGHSYTSKVTTPTCTAQGYTTYTCSCGHSYKDNYVDATGHNYSGGKCVSCGKEDPSLSADSPTISLKEIKSTAGTTIRVPLMISNNPGIVSASITITYDETVMTLVEIEDAGLLSGAVHSPQLNSPYQLTWMNPTLSDNITGNGTIAILVFEISEEAQAGEYALDVSYDFDNYEIVNVDMEAVRFVTNGANVTVIEWIYGDVNNDGRVNMLDGTILARHVAKWPDYTSDKLNMLAADVNNDGKVNMLDSTILARHIAKWPGYSEFPYSN